MAVFEIDDKDAMGRTGELEVGDKTVRTPALMPVINPHLEMPDLREAQIIITNSYIIHGSDEYRDEAVEKGLHNLLGFDGVIVTDSGSYQLSVYGDDEIEIVNREILDFQRDIGTDIGTPLDIPTPPDVPRERAESDWEVTLERIREATEYRDHYLLNAPVQGSLYEDIREEGARQVYDIGLDVYPVGAVVPLMQEYRFAEMVDIVAATKRGLGSDAPVHLFGAGHPMVFALAVALGCDLFDSAAYALYAKDGRYLTPEGTKRVSDLKYLPCACETCTNHTLKEIKDDVNLLAQHNLDVSFGEIRRVRQAVSEGNLLEFVEQRCHAHPKLLNGLKRLGEHDDLLEKYDPTSKSTFFYLGFVERPEVKRHHDRLERIRLESEVVVTPFKASKRPESDAQVLRIEPPFGPFPSDLAHTYPLNAEFPDDPDHDAVGSALEGLLRLARLNPDSRITFENPGWDHPLLETLEEEGIEIKDTDD